MTADEVATVIEPFVRRGLFPNPERAVIEMAGDYILRQIERYRAIVSWLGLQVEVGA